MKKKTFIKVVEELLEVFERKLRIDLDGVQIEGYSRSILGQKVDYYLVEVPKTEWASHTMLFSDNGIRVGLQKHLENYILPQNNITPYCVGEEELPKFYIEWVVNKENKYEIYITIVDNDTAFSFVKSLKEK